MFLQDFYDNMTQVALLLLFHHTVVLLPLRLFSTLVLTNRLHVLTNRVKAALLCSLASACLSLSIGSSLSFACVSLSQLHVGISSSTPKQCH